MAKELKDGFMAFPQGILWLRSHLGSAFLLLLPMFLALIFIVFAMHWVWSDGGKFAEGLLYTKPLNQGVFAWFQYGFLWSLIQFGVLMAAIIGAILFANVLSAPINEYISYKVQRSLHPLASTDVGYTWRGWLRVFRGEILKALLITTISILVLVLPVVNLFSIVAMSFLLGWNFYDYPLARRGYGFLERFRFVLSHGVSVTAFGFWMCIPVIQLFAFPFAVVGGSLLCSKHLDRKLNGEGIPT